MCACPHGSELSSALRLKAPSTGAREAPGVLEGATAPSSCLDPFGVDAAVPDVSSILASEFGCAEVRLARSVRRNG